MNFPGVQRPHSGSASISALVGVVFLVGVVIAGLTVYSAFIAYRTSAIRDMARAEAKQVSGMVFEHLYAVMRKGWTRAEIDDVVHHIQLRLPQHEVTVVRGDPVVKQYGDREGHARLREQDATIRETFRTATPQYHVAADRVRYVYPVLMASECVVCHASLPGEVNGVISVSIPLAVLEAPIVAIVHPMLKLALALIFCLLLATYVILRVRVIRPMEDLNAHVARISTETDYSRDLVAGLGWPRELQALADNFNGLMGQVRSSTDALREGSLRDPLTGLFNRRHFDAALEQAAQDAEQGSAHFAVLMIDLDDFKPVNDLFGHAAGDVVLMNVAKSLQAALRESDIAARLGGDEFVVLALSTSYEEAQALAVRLREVIAQPELRFGHETMHPACSIGIGCYPADGRLGVEVLRTADLAMYADKAARKAKR